MKPIRYMIMAVLLVCMAAGGPLAGETGTALKPDEIKAEPFRDAKSVGKLATGQRVDIVKRVGGWFQISAPKKGWVKMLSIRRGGAATAGVKPSGISALASGRAGTGKVVSTTGIRGLGEEDLRNARFDEDELKLDESYAVTRKEAEKFASRARLKPRHVGYLPE